QQKPETPPLPPAAARVRWELPTPTVYPSLRVGDPFATKPRRSVRRGAPPSHRAMRCLARPSLKRDARFRGRNPAASAHRGAPLLTERCDFQRGLTLPRRVATSIHGTVTITSHRHPHGRVYSIGGPHRVGQQNPLARPVLWAVLFLDTPLKRSVEF